VSRIKKVDLVILVYNEEVNIPRLFERLRADLASLSCAWRVILVDDGSHDRSQPHAVKSLVLSSSRRD
jgi:glycosyltransferase involved in cell wall biosynthesis